MQAQRPTHIAGLVALLLLVVVAVPVSALANARHTELDETRGATGAAPLDAQQAADESLLADDARHVAEVVRRAADDARHVADDVVHAADDVVHAADVFVKPSPGSEPEIVSLAEPSEELLGSIAATRAGENASPAALGAAADAVLRDWQSVNHHGPDPEAHARVLQAEAGALAAGSRPSTTALHQEQEVETMRLLVIAVEFAGTDEATISHPKSMTDRTCVTETLTFTGPLHGQIPPPGPRDNNTLWLPDFDATYYERQIFGTEGVTERVRLDLVDPEDGLPGIDVSGRTMQAYYDQASGGRVRLEAGPAGTVAWLQVPHSEAYYGASLCAGGRAPDIAAMNGLPQNRGRVAQLVRDAADAINAAHPDFPWSEYDTDGNGVVDHVIVFHAGKDKSNGGGVQNWQAIWAHRGSANYDVSDGGTPGESGDDIRIGGYTMQYEDAEPGVIVHEFGHDLGLPDLYDTSRGGANSSEYWDVMGAGGRCGKLNSTHPVMMSTWTKQALGWSEPIVITPTDGLAEVRLGQVSNPPEGTYDAVRVNLPPTPNRVIDLPAGSAQAWWTGADQDWADNGLAHDLSLVGVTGPISLAFDLNLYTERDWDFLFVEVSSDGGQTYTQTKGFQEGSNTERTTPDDYADRNCILGPHPDRPECEGRPNFGGLQFGYTSRSDRWQGNRGGWARVVHDLSPFAGRDVVLRFRHATDNASLGRGAYVDNVVVRSGLRIVFEDPVEDGEMNDWLSTIGSFVPGTPIGEGWSMNSGIVLVPKYYLIEWRNDTGFDEGLRYGYNSVYSSLTEDGRAERQVDVVPMNVPGMLVWLRDLRYGSDPNGTDNNTITRSRIRDYPSEGPKGGVLVVDSHPAPMRGELGGSVSPVDPDTGETYGPFAFPPLDNWRGRVQTSNAAFGLYDTAAMTLRAASGADDPATTIVTPTHQASLPAAPAFHDALGYYPGVEVLPEPIKVMSTSTTLRLKAYALADPDAGVVVPASAYYPPFTPDGFTGLGAETSPPSADVSTDETAYNFDETPEWLSIGEAGGVEVAGANSGHPGSNDLQLGYHFEVIDQAEDGSSGVIRLWNSRYEAEARGEVEDIPCPNGDGWPTMATLRNVGSPAYLLLYSDFDESRDTIASCGGLADNFMAVAVDADTVRTVLEDGGPSMLNPLRVPNDEATAMIWWSGWRHDGVVDTGTTYRLQYNLAPRYEGEHVVAPVLIAAAVVDVGTPVRLFLPQAILGE